MGLSYSKVKLRGLPASFIVALYVLAGCSSDKKTETIPANWDGIEMEARGTGVTMMMWQGDPLINRYMEDYVVPEVRRRFDIDLEIVSGQGNEIVSTVMNELQAEIPVSSLDMIWINGETFYQLRQLDALYGPFVSRLPNNRYINWDSPFIKYDFQQEVNEYECPWGNVQFALIYAPEHVQKPPQNLEELRKWVQDNPGKFTISNDFTGMTLLKSWLMTLAGDRAGFKGDFDEELYRDSSKKLWNYINEIKPYFWNDGETFPENIARMHQLFANGEIWFTMSNNDGEVDNKVNQGVFPETARAYVPSIGTIQNSHYTGILKHSDNKPGAMSVINFLISPEAQWQKMQPAVWGDGTVLDLESLPVAWKNKFENVPGRERAPRRSDIQGRALMEPSPEYMIRLFEDFRKFVIEE